MADPRRRLAANVPGEFFVDSTCINCDACRQLAPATFSEQDEFSFVFVQPSTPEDRRRAFRALIACPTGSIGAASKAEAREVLNDFPLPLAGGVHYCGFNSPKSYGGNSYLVIHPDGNWLIDSPRYTDHLVRRLDALGGVGSIFLTHRDDVADAARYAERFSSRRIIHRLELAAQPDAEQVLDGFEPIPLAPEFLAIPTPGHTRGHCALLYREQFLFTGDHLWWSRDRGRLHASRSVCWHSWPQQVRSLDLLRRFTFEWVLPGHGERICLPAEEMRRQLDLLLSSLQVTRTA